MSVQKPPSPDDKKKKSPFLTTGEKVPNFLGIALIAALLLHLLAVPFFPNLAKPQVQATPQAIAVQKKAIIKPPPTPKPTPPPTPTPPPPTKATPPPKQQPVQPKLRVHQIHAKNVGSGPTETNNNPKTGNSHGTPTGHGTASPVPAPTATAPACAVPFKDATPISVSQPNYPSQATDAGFGAATVNVVVSLTATGSVAGVSIQNPSGNFAIDREALRAARDTTYSPKIVNCTAVSSQYIFTADFTPD